MQILIDLATNATMQAWIWGPLMGVVFGVLFSGLTNSPAIGAPVTVIHTKKVFVQNINVNRSPSGSGSDSIAPFFIVAGIGLLFVVWNYVVYIELIHYWLWVILSTVLSFSLAIIVVSLIRGQFTSGTWIAYIVVPIVLLAGCGYIIDLAKKVIDPNLPSLAVQYSFLDFYMKVLSPYGRSLAVSHVLGIGIAFLVIIFTGVALLHYLALMNQRSLGLLHGFWVYLTRITLFFSGKAWFFLMGGGLLLAYLLVEPWAIPNWMTR